MTFLTRLEGLFGRFAIPGLIRYVVALNAFVYLLVLLKWPVVEWLALIPQLVWQGQIWRLVTWILVPDQLGLLWIFFYLFFLWWVGDVLEATWGSFRLNLYYFLGYAACTVVALIFGVPFGNLFLNASLLFAVATLAPDLEILFFFLPLRLKWVALITLLWPFGFLFVTGGTAIQLLIVACLANYIVFFGPSLVRSAHQKQHAAARRATFEAAKREESETLHRCEVCGATENTAADLDFRVAADGHEYCAQHIPRRTG